MFRGAIVAIVTPFKNGKVDEAALRKLVEFQIKNGTDGIVPCGTTGESSTLSHEEHDRVIEVVIDAAKKRVPVIAGTGSNSTAEAIRLTRHAYKAGADGALMVCPYYNRPTQEDCISIIRRLQKRYRFRLLCITFLAEQASILIPIPWPDSPK